MEDTSLNNPKVRKTQEWFRGIDSLRFVLAFIVLIGHFYNPGINALKTSNHVILRAISYLYSIAFNGPAAVIAFFILSGFVIHYPYQTKQINLKKFYIRRFTRILIPLIIIMIVGSFLGNPEVGVTWSLICELIYYTLYPFIIKIKIPLNLKITIAVLLYLLLMLLTTKNIFYSFIHQHNNSYYGDYIYLGNYYTWIIGLPCWLVGVKLAENIDLSDNKPRFSRLLMLRATCWLAATFFLVLKFHFFLSYIYSLNILCFIFYYWLKDEINYYRYAKPFAYLEAWGKFSYSLYLCHLIWLTLLAKVIAINLYNYIFIVILIIFLSYLFYLVVERNAHIQAKKWALKA